MSTSVLLSTLQKNGVAVGTEYPIGECICFRVACLADMAIFPKTEEELRLTLRHLDDEGIRTEILGNGSNVLFAEPTFHGAVVFTEKINGFSFEDTECHADCGTLLTGLAAKAAKAGLSGIEFVYGIPGSVGGAVFMNAGAYGGAISDVLHTSMAYDRETQTVREIRDHGFGYRQSVYMQNPSLVCLSASFSLQKGDTPTIEAKMKENMQMRRDKQPLEYPSAGSYFKRPEGHFAGKLIEDCGLKGLRIGGAEVSEKHAGFLINRGGATAKDILMLEEEVKRRVLARFGVELEREVRVIE